MCCPNPILLIAYDPNLDGKSSVTRFTEDTSEDEFGLTTLTLNGRIGKLDMIYTVGYLDRDMESYIDYSAYTNGGGYQVYYLCPGYADDGAWARSGTASPPVTCHDPEAGSADVNSNQRVTFGQGFRPPVTNRNAGKLSNRQTGPYEGYRVPAVALTDKMDNYEWGIKADFSGNLRARYEFDVPVMGGASAYLSGGLSYTGESKSGIAGGAFQVEDTLVRTHGRGSGLEIAAEGGDFVGGNCGTVSNPVVAVHPQGRHQPAAYLRRPILLRL
ncbi:MAG: hypothetical protein OXI88_04250 [Gammaproteobacteria bacterium]|nr:hypothetical protein [Gammaproteobacteria bacterium]